MFNNSGAAALTNGAIWSSMTASSTSRACTRRARSPLNLQAVDGDITTGSSELGGLVDQL